MFNLREYIKNGFIKAVGKMSDYQIILNSAGWHEKGVLTEEDLSEINEAIENQYKTVAENETTSLNLEKTSAETTEETAESLNV